MGKFNVVLGALFFLSFSFVLSEGNIINESTNTQTNEVLEKNSIVIVENLKLHGIREQCNKQGDVWYCCVGIESKLNFSACISIAYLEEEYGLELNVTVDGILIIHEKASLKNPPPFCFHVPYLEKVANACFRLHDLDDKNKTISGCVDFEGHVEGLRVFKFNLGCFKIPMNWLEKELKYAVKIMDQSLG